MLFAALIIGSLFGVGTLTLINGIIPGGVTYEEHIQRINNPTLSTALPPLRQRRIQIGQRIAELVIPYARSDHYKAAVILTNTDQNQLLADATAFLIAMPIIFGGSAALGAYGGLPHLFSPQIAILVGVIFGALGFYAQFEKVRTEAKKKSEEFDFAIVNIAETMYFIVASGRGYNEALEQAINSGRSWPYQLIRNRIKRESTLVAPSVSLANLATEIQNPDLRELAATIAVAEDGGNIQASLESRATTMRQNARQMLLEQAERIAPKLIMPLMFIMVGFMIFIIYPTLEVIVQHFP